MSEKNAWEFLNYFLIPLFMMILLSVFAYHILQVHTFLTGGGEPKATPQIHSINSYE